MKFNFFLENEEATKQFGEDFALCLKIGDLITLKGDLGAGKSSLARSIIRTLSNDNNMDIPSPTFTLVQNYELERFNIAHADIYRISSSDEIDELGFEDALQDGAMLVEWPQKAEGRLDDAAFSVELLHENHGRRLYIEAVGDAATRLKHTLTVRQFLKNNGRGDVERRYFTGDASARSYETLRDNHKIEILMNAPEMEMPDNAAISYAKIAHLATNIKQFIGTDWLINNNGFTVPQIAAYDIKNGLLISNDLGRDGIIDDERQPIIERYIACAELLAEFHQKQWPDFSQFDDFSMTIPHYDQSVMNAEISLLPDWYLGYAGLDQFDAPKRALFFAQWQPYLDILVSSQSSFVMRDYHSPNIIWRSDKKGHDRIGLIDFQDGQIGSTAYDLVSLAQDARVRISQDLEQQVLNAYCVARNAKKRPFDEQAFRLSYSIAGAQRGSKLLGLFVRLYIRDGKPGYLKHLPHMQEYLLRNLAHPDLENLRLFYEQYQLIQGAK